MKTLKEVVDEVGFPVYVEWESCGSIVGGVDPKTKELTYTNLHTLDYTSYADIQGGYLMSDTKVTYYESLKDDCSLETPVHLKVNNHEQSECTCPTLLSGHHQGCSFGESKWTR